MAKEFKRYLVTSALPYANGPVHIGHLAGVYIPSDIYTRYLRLRGRDVISVCGSDEHGVPITIKARKEGVTPQQIVDRYHNLIKKSFEGLGMSFDIYSRTSSPVRVPRDPVTLMQPQTAGLFPAGEGAGYAGGIISAALDGERIAEAVTNYIK